VVTNEKRLNTSIASKAVFLLYGSKKLMHSLPSEVTVKSKIIPDNDKRILNLLCLIFHFYVRSEILQAVAFQCFSNTDLVYI